MLRRPRSTPGLLVPSLVLALALAAGGAQALSLTAAGATAGFSLSTFADGFPSASNIGPLGIGFTAGGGVVVTDYPGNVRTFTTDADGQSAASFAPGQSYGLGNAVGIATVGTGIYMTRQTIGDLVQINADGTFNQAITSGLPAATGIVTNPLTGHLYVSTLGNNGIWDVDPIAKTKTLLMSHSADGLATDGHTLYMEENGAVTGYDLATQAQVFNSGPISGVDGTSLGYGTLAGKIFANTNYGQVYEIDLATDASTLIADGGTRGDFVTPDPNGSLLLTQSNSIERLTAPQGGGFGTVPEAGTGMLMALGCLGLAGIGLSRRRSA